MAIRIQKYLSEQGIASRREAERLLVAGRIKINGRVVRTLGITIEPGKDKVEVLGLLPYETKRSILIYKPRGMLSSHEAKGETVFALSPEFKDLHPAGRLDKESEGLIILTNDGTLARILTSDDHVLEKEYEVEVREPLKPFMIRAFEKGVMLEDGPRFAEGSGGARKTLPTKAELISVHRFTIVLHEGRKHQIRRMCALFRLTVTRLIRIRIGSIEIGNLKPGKFRFLSEREVSSLKSTVR